MRNCHLEFPERATPNGTGKTASATLAGTAVSGTTAVIESTVTDVLSRLGLDLSCVRSPSRDSLTIDELTVQGDRWLRDCRRRKHTDASMAMNRFIVDKLLWYLRRDGFEVCNEEALEAFTLYVSEGHNEPGGRWGEATARAKRPLSRRTNKTYYQYLNVLFNWMVQMEVLDVSPMRRLAPPEYQPDQQLSFTREELVALLAAAEASRQAHRNVAILLALLDTGLRESEFCALRIWDVDLDEGRIAVLNGKGEKSREVYISSAARSAIMHYLDAGGRDAERDKYESLWLSERGGVLGGPLTPSGLLELFHRLGAAAGLRTRCHPHKMRRTFATELLDGDVPLNYVQRQMGHSTPKQTLAYHYAADKRVRESHSGMSPADRLLAGRSRKSRRR